MPRATIDFGIDLGTTNSAIAVLKGTKVEVFKNPLGAEYTPSAVWIDPRTRLHVGQPAKDRIEDDEENAVCEFKLLMGIEHDKVFQRTGKKMKPPELSAWVLKALKRDVQRATGEDIRAAVITIPADFDTPQREATKKAAQLAGFVESPLLHEPVAAGLAYGFQSRKDNVYWLVYDLGGGTFDAAVLQIRGGEIRVVNHGGDKRLGGKLFDWEIVEQLLVPALLRERPAWKNQDFRRGNPRWRAVYAKLKWWAEIAKIKLSETTSFAIHIDNLAQDDAGRPITFHYDLTRSAVDHLIEPYILRTVNIGRKVLEDAHLTPQSLEKVILVGGPTQGPLLRQMIPDASAGLGIPIDFSVDPMTVVARGAAIFAGTQRLPASALPAPPPGTVVLQLDYKPVGTDTEPMVGGLAIGDAGQSFAGYTVEFVHAHPRAAWRSGKIELTPDGKFLTSLWAGQGANQYLVELCDPTGRQTPTHPDRLLYTFGNVFTDPPLTHSIGVAMANNEVDVFFSKGTPLPCRQRRRHRTVKPLRVNEEGDWLTIPIVEGENERRADRNQLIGQLVIHSAKIKREVPAGNDIEITLEVDTDHLIKARAFVPLLDQEFKAAISYKDYHKRSQNPGQMRQDIDQEKQRLEQARSQARRVRDDRAEQGLARIDAERMEEQVEQLFQAAAGDPETAAACHERLVDLRSAIDEVEDALEWPNLLEQAEKAHASLREIANNYGTSSDRELTMTLQHELDKMRQARDPQGLRRKIKEVDGLKYRILQEQPGFWLGLLDDLENYRSSMPSAQADALFRTARNAANSNNTAALRAAVQQLIGLIPPERQGAVAAFGASTQR